MVQIPGMPQYIRVCHGICRTKTGIKLVFEKIFWSIFLLASVFQGASGKKKTEKINTISHNYINTISKKAKKK